MQEITAYIAEIEKIYRSGSGTEQMMDLITNYNTLIKLIADKARLLSYTIEQALLHKENEDDILFLQMQGFKKVLLHALDEKSFSDIYSQTLSYGMFAARLNDNTQSTFTRFKAAQLIPLHNPFLRKFFQYIAGYDLDERIAWIVDALANLFNTVAIEDILKEFAKMNRDPYIHFYETFLAEYDPALRKSRGVWYTPESAVQFIVRSVDEVLINEFNLKQGLADQSKVKLAVKQKDGSVEEAEFHKLQILDPALGTGTFLTEVINVVHKKFLNQQGLWSGYCREHLIPRLCGFEILMTPYSMAHLKLDMKLKETGFSWDGAGRLNVYLTNSLEEPPAVAPEFFMVKWLSDEAEEANKIKRDTPVMVVMGNPPYNVSTQNKGEWIDTLLGDYKTGVTETNLQPLSDDYIKFVRFGQHYIEKNKSGVVAYICNNSFLDGLIHRQMRQSLIKSFDKIYILNLHGSVRKKEDAPEHEKDENVFDIQQGVSINIFIKKPAGKNKEAAQVLYADLYGIREKKYTILQENTVSTIQWTLLNPVQPFYFFVPKDFSGAEEYEHGFKITDLFKLYTSGIKTHNDAELVSFTSFKQNNQKYLYRPFDFRFINYDLQKVMRNRYKVMKNMLSGENLSLIFKRSFAFNSAPAYVSNTLSDERCWTRPGSQGGDYAAPLYIYPDKHDLDNKSPRKANFNLSVIKEISLKTGLHYTEEKPDTEGAFAPVDVLDYIYAVMNSNNYRNRYNEFLKIDFPRIPYPTNTEQFLTLAAYGRTLRNLHLLEGVEASDSLAAYPIAGSNKIENIIYKDGNVYINDKQHFKSVSNEIWEYRIGGYQIAKDYLRWRKGQTLNTEQIQHYQKIINALHLTIEVQAHIDMAL